MTRSFSSDIRDERLDQRQGGDKNSDRNVKNRHADREDVRPGVDPSLFNMEEETETYRRRKVNDSENDEVSPGKIKIKLAANAPR